MTFYGVEHGRRPATVLPTMTALSADEIEAIRFSIGVLSTHSGDTQLSLRVQAVFREHAERLQGLLDRAKLSLNHR